MSAWLAFTSASPAMNAALSGSITPPGGTGTCSLASRTLSTRVLRAFSSVSTGSIIPVCVEVSDGTFRVSFVFKMSAWLAFTFASPSLDAAISGMITSPGLSVVSSTLLFTRSISPLSPCLAWSPFRPVRPSSGRRVGFSSPVPSPSF